LLVIDSSAVICSLMLWSALFFCSGLLNHKNYLYTAILSLLELAQMKKGKKIISNAYPLSPMQSGLLFQALYDPSSDAYFVQSVFELAREVDAQALQSAWQIVSDHHPILRTGIVWEKLEHPLQYVLESTEVLFTEYDWQNIPDQQQQIMLEDFIQEDRKKGFDLSQAPLFRLALIKCAKDKHYLVWSQHHILTDGWCGPIILGDVFKAYQDIKQKKEPRLTTRRPYQDYIAWLQQQDIVGAEIFWKDYLLNLEGPTRLSFKDIIEENQEQDYDTYALVLSLEETDQIRSFAGEYHLTLNTVIQGAVALVLKTYTQQPEITIGITVSGRSIPLPGVEEMVGLFINTLPLRVSFQPEESLVSFLTNLQEQAQKLNEHTYIPLAQIQSWAGFNQSLFDVIFVFENYPLGEDIAITESSLKISNVKGIEKTEYPLTIAIGSGKQLHLCLSYQTKHFNEELIKRLTKHIRQVLQNISCKQGASYSAAQSIDTLSLLSSQEQRQLLIEWNDTNTDYPEAKDKTIAELFEEQVTRSPNNIAVVYEDQELPISS
jgi:Condensation domain